jgi:hypothetical protein
MKSEKGIFANSTGLAFSPRLQPADVAACDVRPGDKAKWAEALGLTSQPSWPSRLVPVARDTRARSPRSAAAHLLVAEVTMWCSASDGASTSVLGGAHRVSSQGMGSPKWWVINEVVEAVGCGSVSMRRRRSNGVEGGG